MNTNVIVADIRYTDWLISHDLHVSAHWVKRCLSAGEYIIALADAEPAGFLRYSWFWGVIPYMDMIWVIPQYRRRGIGGSLFQHWESAMREQQATQLMTSSVADEKEPQQFHRSNGFREAGAISFGKFQPQSEVFLIKDL
ncbi:GNAT family N-acetyltransferase [Brucella sp. RRSP16]|uniref:GNAT family N-acetyltransferase n=1 Tax=Brucella sp. RRSP16 TaxID=3453707 RepID=UPI003FCC766B